MRKQEMRKTLLILPYLMLAFMLVSCGSQPKQVEIKATPEEKIVVHPNPPDQLNMREVKWTLFNREKLEKLLTENPNAEIVMFAISAKGYENLSLNFREVIRYIEDQKDIIIYYRILFPTPEKLAEEPEE